MPIYTSKNAINNIPLAKQDQTNNDEGGKLHCLLLQNNSRLVDIAAGGIKTSPLKIGDENEAVKLVKVALNFINERDDLYPEYNITKLDVNTYKFDSKLENAITLFQEKFNIPVTNVVDCITILKIDSKFLGDEFFDAERKKYIGKSSKKEFSFVQQSLANNKYEYSISFRENDRPIKIELDTVLKGKIVRKDIFVNDKNLNINLSNKTKNEILNKPEVQQIFSRYGIDGQNFTILLDPAETKVQFGTAKTFTETFILDYKEEEENTPPLLFDDEDAKLHKIEEGDSPEKIILDNYYGGGGSPIMDPYNNTVIFNLPERKAFPVAKRKYDSRFQFYLNLLYYYNSEEKGSSIKEWGLVKTKDYQRYPVNHLNNINIFENEFYQDEPKTALPNYYRFLKEMERLNPKSKIEFDSNGNTTSFSTIKGKNIRIPSRKFADSMYYFLNFRPNEMLTPVTVPPTTPNSQPTSVMDYVIDEVLDLFVNKAGTALENIVEAGLDYVDEMVDDAIALYQEAAEFFKKAYNFAIDVITKYWPRGLGGTIAIGGSITWGIPIQTKGNIEKSLSRKMSKEKELIIVYSTQSTFGVGADVAVGTSLGLHTGGHGTSKKKFGLNVGAGAGKSYDIKIGNEYEFPVRKEETALLTMIINVFGGAMVNATADVLEYFDVINLNPRQYLTKFEVSFEKSLTGWAGAQVGVDRLDENGKPSGISTPTENQDTPEQQNSNKGYGLVDNIFNKLPGMGATGEAAFKSGVAFSYEVDYGENPLTKNHEGRVFKTIDIDTNYYSQNTLSFGLLGGFLKKIFVNLLPGAQLIGAFFKKMSFDEGTMFGVKYSLERVGTADSLGPGDFNFTGQNVIVDTLSGHSIKYSSPGEKVIKQISLYYSTFTGDVNSLCQPGTEIKYNFNVGTLYKMIKDRETYDYSFKNVLSLFRSIEFHKKVGTLNINTGQTKLVRVKMPDNNLTGLIVGAHRDRAKPEVELISKMLEQSLKLSKSNAFFEGGLAIDVKMELKISEIAKVILFYLKKLNYKYASLTDGSQRKNFERDLEKERLKIHNAIKAKAKLNQTNNEDQVVAELGAHYYDKLFDDNESGIYPNTNVVGLNVVMDQFIRTKPEIDYVEALLRFLKGIKPFNLYMNNVKRPGEDDPDYGMTKIIDYFNFIATLAHLDVTLEAKAGVNFGGTVKVGEGATIGAALEALFEINYQAKLYNNGNLTFLDPQDPLRIVYEEIRSLLGFQKESKRIAAKTILQV
ncbi:hypothetical protein Flavo103_03190 [Flavobacterium collinsii]|uniref:hypothetical protein n=1 Tax=Flavobacterium collinsii TaxID=1114861 RepID=UPI0022C3786F|nr:hypothetical protein [Flavobacterium collinsii]GIQ57183.1 hypothetical protein Flavo103_03190 [Flavobacterium collinsii]